jgi:hypothetical protein
MSKTDKTDPSWVKLKKNTKLRREIHNHYLHDSVCDLREPTNNYWKAPFRGGDYCFYYVNFYGYNSGFYPRTSKWLKSEISLRHGAARARLRRDVHEMLKLDREELIDYNIINPRDRHSATWDWS